MTGRFNKPCLRCGTLTRNPTYCDTHKPIKEDTPQRKAVKSRQYNSDFRKLAKQVRDNATHCWICGGGPRPNDPWQADHVVPGDLTGGLLPAHRSCNASRGNRPAR